jgi:hypothetical protein
MRCERGDRHHEVMGDRKPLGRAGLARHHQLIEMAVVAAEADERIIAAWLVGSLASDYADEVSDIDFHILVRSRDFDAFAAEGWIDFLATFTQTVMAKPFEVGHGGYAITSDWMHFDVAVHREGSDFFRAGSGLRPLFDRSGTILPSESSTHSIQRGAPYFPTAVVNWFFYMLGNLAVVVRRDEPVLGMNGAVQLRDTCLVPLMHAEAGVTRTGGNKRMRTFLTAPQHILLEALPPLKASLPSVIDYYAAVSEPFVTIGRALAQATDAKWPEAFESATADHLERMIGRRIPSTG